MGLVWRRTYEGSAGACQYRTAELWLVVVPFEELLEFIVAVGADAVEGSGPRQCHQEDLGGWVGEFGEGHGWWGFVE